MSGRAIVLLTDFGTRDWYVGALKGVLLSRAPHARVIDLTHEIPPQDVLAGAFTLGAAAPWFPKGTVFLTVVDPGVGGARALVAARADGRFFVGPDNGLLTFPLRRAARVSVVELANRRYWLAAISETFHGRDILAPVAAHLARGGSLRVLGPVKRRVATLEWPSPTPRGQSVMGEIIHIDAFGNLITNLEAARWLAPARARAVMRYNRARAPVVSSYAQGRPHQLIAVVNALGLIELAIRESSAAWSQNAKRGDRVELLLGS